VAEHLFLVGMMGAGKSTVGALVARRLGMPFVDTDAAVEDRAGATVADVFERDGEPAFRAMESEALAESARDPRPSVIAVGGGAVLDATNRHSMRSAGAVVWLRASAATLADRVGQGEGRPLLSGPDGSNAAAIGALAARRDPLYSEVCDAVVDVDGRSPEDVTNAVLDARRILSGGPL
jgi:shikimate kinase